MSKVTIFAITCSILGTIVTIPALMVHWKIRYDYTAPNVPTVCHEMINHFFGEIDLIRCDNGMEYSNVSNVQTKKVKQ